MEQEFDFRQVPRNWALCYISECPRHGECLRYQACLMAPDRRVYHKCILPSVLRQGDCQHFCSVQKVRAAVGFRNIFRSVLARDIADIRKELMAYLGSRNTFFRYQRGDLLLLPAQQQWIQQLLRRYGYTDDVTFDAYREVYLF